jgi:hypothetical protein
MSFNFHTYERQIREGKFAKIFRSGVYKESLVRKASDEPPINSIASPDPEAARRERKRRRAALRRAGLLKQSNEGDMNSTDTILKNASKLGEAGITKVITDHARTLHPTLTPEQAFTKEFCRTDSVGKAYRTIYAIAKQGAVDDDGDEPDADDDIKPFLGIGGGNMRGRLSWRKPRAGHERE